jgi:HK97 family phage major capsid protein
VDRSNLQERTFIFAVDERASDDAIPVVISTDAVVEVHDGPELLMHSAGAVDLSRAPLPLIDGHRSGDRVNVGVIDELAVGEGKLRGVAHFGSRAEALAYKKDVLAKIIRSVSVRYARVKARMRADGVLVTERWMPLHVAMVAEPADGNAGFFRASDIPVFELVQEVPAVPATTKEHSTMTTETVERSAATATAEAVQVVDHAAPERLRITTIQTMCRQHRIADEQRDEWINDGTSIDDATRKILEAIAERSKHAVKESPAMLGMSPVEVGQYSIARAIRACVEKSWPKVAPYEAEMSKALAQRLGKQSGEHTFFVPLDVQWAKLAQRDLVVATASAGGYLVGTNTQSFIEMLRNRSVVMRLGATTMPGLVGSVAIPKQLTAATANWFASEAGTATESNLTFGQLALIPKTVSAYVELSRQLLLQSTPNAEGVVNRDLSQVLALAVDLAALNGPGTAGQPTGIANTSGVGTANPGTGTNIAYADAIRFQTTVAGSNAFLPGFGYVTTPTIAGILMGKPRFTNSDTPVWGGNILDGTMVGAPAMTSLQVSSGTMFGGDFSQVIIGEWGVLEVEANPYAQFQAGIVGVRALYTVDVGIRYPAAFAIGTGMTA